jgi:hypothetical protein
MYPHRPTTREEIARKATCGANMKAEKYITSRDTAATVRRLPDMGAYRETPSTVYIAVPSLVFYPRPQHNINEPARPAARWHNERSGPTSASARGTISVLPVHGHAMHFGLSSAHPVVDRFEPLWPS